MEYFRVKDKVKWVEFRDFVVSLDKRFSKDNGVMFEVGEGAVNVYIACENPAFAVEIAKKYPLVREMPPISLLRFASDVQYGHLGEPELFDF